MNASSVRETTATRTDEAFILPVHEFLLLALAGEHRLEWIGDGTDWPTDRLGLELLA